MRSLFEWERERKNNRRLDGVKMQDYQEEEEEGDTLKGERFLTR